MHPAGEERADLRAGIIAATTANGLGGKKGGGSFVPRDFMPRFGAEKVRAPARDWEDQKLSMLGRAAMLGDETARQKLLTDYAQDLREEHERIEAWMAEQRQRWQAEQAERKAV